MSLFLSCPFLIEEKRMSRVSFYGSGYCEECDSTWEFGPVEDGTLLESDHECESERDGE